MGIQTPYKCNNYTKNDNLNKTCKNSSRCELIDNDNCYQFDNTKDCSTCKRLTIETYTGVCDLFGVLNSCMNKCNYYQGDSSK